MKFSDEDLKQFRTEYDEMSVDKIEALLHRLKCAEAVCGWAESSGDRGLAIPLSAWLRSKGQRSGGE